MKKLISLLLAMVMILALFAGCGSSSATEESEEEPESAETTDTATEVNASGLPDSYPLLCDDGSLSLSMYQSMVPILTDIEDFNDLYFWQEVSSRTGVTLEWQMVSFTVAEEQLNLLIAADDLPNIVCTAQYYTDGISSAVENDVFADIADYLEDYAPDYLEIVSQDDVYPVVFDDNGSIVYFYEIGSEEFPPNNGVFLRGDLLAEQGLDIPVTYDEYEETFLALKNAYDMEAPIYYDSSSYPDWIASGLNVSMDFSLDADGNCIYGPVEDNFREYLQIMNRWYEEGLLYQDFYSVSESDSSLVDYMSSGKSAVAFQYCETIGTVELSGEGEYFSAGYLPRENEDDEIHLSSGIDTKVLTSRCWGIGANSTEEEIQTACMLMNYFYTEEGALLLNYGVEGLSFEYQDDGTPWYTDLIIDNPDGLTQTQAMITYIGWNVPGSADYTKYNVSALTDWAEFVEVWGEADNAWAMPQVSLSVEEEEAYSAVSTDVETYLEEAVARFIIGDLDIDDDAAWENYLEYMNSLGVNTMIEVYSAALERFNER